MATTPTASKLTEGFFRVNFKAVQRSKNESVGKAVAYGECAKFQCASGRYNFSQHAHENVGSCVIIPGDAPAELRNDKVALIDSIEAADKRWDSQPARSVLFSIPREVPPEKRMDFARHVAELWTANSRVVFINVHNPRAADGEEQPHIHYVISRRSLGPDGFSAKKDSDSEWTADSVHNKDSKIRGYDMRVAVAKKTNEWFAHQKIDVRVDPRSKAARGDETPTERNVSKRSIEAYKRDPKSDAAGPWRDTIEARSVRRQLRAARRENTVFSRQFTVLQDEAEARSPGLRPRRRRRRRERFKESWLPVIGGQIAKIEREGNRATMTLKGGQHLQDFGDYVRIKGRLDRQAVAALADAAARHGWQEIEITGRNEKFRAHLEAALKERGIKVQQEPTPSSVDLNKSPEYAPAYRPPWTRPSRASK